jgi:hypothetical protein
MCRPVRAIFQSSKRLESLMELLRHRPKKIAWLSNPEYVPATLNLAAVMQSAETLGIEVERWEVRKADDLDRAFAAAAGSEAVLVQWLGLTQCPLLADRRSTCCPPSMRSETTWLPVD